MWSTPQHSLIMSSKCGVRWVWLLMALRDDVLGTAVWGLPGQGKSLPWLSHLLAEKIITKNYKGTPLSILDAPAPVPSLYQPLITAGNAHCHWQVKCVCKDITTAVDMSLQAGINTRVMGVIYGDRKATNWEEASQNGKIS